MAASPNESEKRNSSPSRTTKTAGAGIGELLKLARERQGLTLEQVARETRIPRKHLEALEHDNIAALPGPFYQRAEIRTYARAVHLDPEVILRRLDRGAPAAYGSSKAADPESVLSPTRSRSRQVLVAAGVVLVMMVVWRAVPGNLWLNGQARDSRAEEPPPTPAPSAESSPAVESSDRVDPERVPAAVPSGDKAPTVGVNAPVPVVAGDDLAASARLADERPAVSGTELVVATDPPGARVTVDGIGWGVTPVTIRYLPPGEKRLRVIKEGYTTVERVVKVVAGRRETADIQLQDEPR